MLPPARMLIRSLRSSTSMDLSVRLLHSMSNQLMLKSNKPDQPLEDRPVYLGSAILYCFCLLFHQLAKIYAQPFSCARPTAQTPDGTICMPGISPATHSFFSVAASVPAPSASAVL